MDSKIALYLLLFVNASTLLAGQLLVKLGLRRGGPVALHAFVDVWHFIIRILTTPLLLLGLVVSSASTLLWMFILSRADLSLAGPTFNGIYYVLLMGGSLLVLGEVISPWRWAGAAAMIGGLLLMAKG